jgi:hypothetical protein
MKIEDRSFPHPTALVQAGGRRIAPAAEKGDIAKIAEETGETQQPSPLRNAVFEGVELAEESARRYRNRGKETGHFNSDLLLAMIAKMGGEGPPAEKGTFVDLHV